jgi:hypothetical protein
MQRLNVKKRFLFTVGILVSSLSASAYAERKYGMAGCGLGSLIFKPSGNQSSAAISNGSFGSQSFGITTGTSNCTPSGSKEAAVQEQEDFFVANYSTLSKEIAQGSGDSVVAFAGVLGCDPAQAGAVGAELQAHYETIFKAPGAVAAFETARASIREAPTLDGQCLYL